VNGVNRPPATVRVLLMEKNTIIAFVLSFLVLIAWSFLFGPQQEQAPKETEPVAEKGGKLTSEQPQSKVPEGLPPPKEQEAPAALAEAAPALQKDILVETPLYEATFSSVVARFKSFRLKKYRVTTDPRAPFVELLNSKDSGQNYLGVAFDAPSPKAKEAILYHVSKDRVQLEQGASPQEITFTGKTSDGLSVQQTFRFHPDRYPIDLTVTVQNRSNQDAEGAFRASLQNMPPQDKQSYYAFVGLALASNNKLQEIESGDLKETKNISGQIGWIAYESEYFMTAFIPQELKETAFQGRKLSTGALEATLSAPAVALTAGAQASSGYTIYLGPRELGIVKEIGKNLDLAIDFGWTNVIAKPLLYSLRFFNKYVGNYGIAIIILTVLVKILFWPLTHKSYKSMKEMQKIQPLMAKLREKYKNNREQMNKEMMALYRTYKVNPMGGCLPMVIQIPVFFALFRILGSAIELRHAPFLWWINDLSAPDRLFSFPFEIPFMTPPYGIPVLTLFMGASMFIQQKMTPTPGDQTQAKIMMMLPIIFTVMFINFPSGLVLYWLVNNILSIGQQYRILRKSA